MVRCAERTELNQKRAVFSVDPAMLGMILRANAPEPCPGPAFISGNFCKTTADPRNFMSDTTSEGERSTECGSDDSDLNFMGETYAHPHQQMTAVPQPMNANIPQPKQRFKSGRMEAVNELKCSNFQGHAPANSSPAAFGAAWKMACQHGLWKEEENSQPRGHRITTNGAKPGKKDSGKKPAAESVPLPKWFPPSASIDDCSSTASAPERVSVSRPPGLLLPSPPPGLLEEPETKPEKSKGNTHAALRQGDLMMAGIRSKQVSRIPEDWCDSPLKITPKTNYDASSFKTTLDPAMPCKKRLPNWSF